MRKLIIILLIFIIFASGCTSKETKYVSSNNKQMYVMLSSDGTAFYHTGGVENYKGTWKEVQGDREPEITVFLDDGSSLVFRKLSEDMIGLKVEIKDNNGGIVRYYKED